MKRATSTGSTSPQRSPQHKKPRLEDMSITLLEENRTGTTMSTTTGITNIKGTLMNGRNAFGVFSEGRGQGEGADGAEWTKVEKGKRKKARNVENRISNHPPRFFYSSKEIVQRRDPVGISDIRELVIHLIGDGPSQPWLKVENPTSIQKVIVAQIPGLTNSLLNLPPIPTDPTSNPNMPLTVPPLSASTSTATLSSPHLPFISQTFLHALPTRAPGEPTRMHSVLGSFFMGPVSGEEKRRRILARLDEEKKGKMMSAGAGSGLGDVEKYLLSAEEMAENEYPVPSYVGEVSQLGEGWVESPKVEDSDSDSGDEDEDEDEEMEVDGKKRKVRRKDEVVYALDCEMCMTEDGKELTRVCVVDANTEKVVLDELVKPIKPVTDYLTRFSGITASHLANVTTTLPLVQSKLLKLFNSQTILLGHSLEQDLRALKLAHPRCIDTAIVYHHPRGRPLKPGLAWLTKKWCGREIQTGGEGGHDPEEDARACVELLKKKVANGPGFGEFKTDQESILERLARSTTRNIATAVVDYGNPSTWHGSKATMAIACKSDEEILNGMVEAVPRCQFVFGRFLELSDALEWSTPKNETPAVPLPTALSNLNMRLSALHAALPPRTALILFSGHSDPRMMAALGQRKQKWENEIRMGRRPEEVPKEEAWTVQDGRALEEETAKARRGLAFLCLKAEK